MLSNLNDAYLTLLSKEENFDIPPPDFKDTEKDLLFAYKNHQTMSGGALDQLFKNIRQLPSANQQGGSKPNKNKYRDAILESRKMIQGLQQQLLLQRHSNVILNMYVQKLLHSSSKIKNSCNKSVQKVDNNIGDNSKCVDFVKELQKKVQTISKQLQQKV
tara:strand:- start:53 stop:532 length:480 start_codon:yes stop_codon:yes gene_type:complete